METPAQCPQAHGEAVPIEELLGRALQGDGPARLDLAVHLARRIYKIAIMEAPKCGLRWQQEDYDDFCQDMLKAMFEADCRRLRTIRNPKAFAGWIRVAVAMALIDRRRRRVENQRQRTDSLQENIGVEGEDFSREDILAGDTATPDEKLLYRERLGHVRRAVAEVLSQEDQQIMALWGRRLYSHEEIGLLLGMNPNTVGVRITRAKVKVLEHVKRQEEGSI